MDTNTSLEDLLKQQESIQAAIEAKRASMKLELKQEAAAFVQKVEQGIEGSSYEAVQFIAASVGLNLSSRTGASSGTKQPRKRLNEDQKSKIAELHGQGMSTADISKRIYTAPTSADYQRINTYIKKLVS